MSVSPMPSLQPLGDTPPPDSHEAAMVIVQRDADGRPTVWCDPEIADLVGALNSGGVPTVASCSGHGTRPGDIALMDGRYLIVAQDEAEWQRLCRAIGQHQEKKAS